jgi:hypothetical protein
MFFHKTEPICYIEIYRKKFIMRYRLKQLWRLTSAMICHFYAGDPESWWCIYYLNPKARETEAQMCKGRRRGMTQGKQERKLHPSSASLFCPDH